MISVLKMPFWNFRAANRQTGRTASAPKRRSQPVYIYDAITPWGDETMLLKLLREQAVENKDQS